MQLYIGQNQLRGHIEHYKNRYNLLELHVEPGKVPRPNTLGGWARAVGESFAFSVVLPRALCELSDDPQLTEELVELTLRSAEALGARWLVLQTPPSVTPSRRSIQRLSTLISRLPETPWLRAWEPRGVWEAHEASRLAEELELRLVRDISREPAPPGEAVYARLRGLGVAAGLPFGALERAASELEGRSEAYVVIEAENVARAATGLRRAVAALEEAESGDHEA